MTRVFLLIASLFVLGGAPVSAQNPFAPVIEVNEDVITAWELQQRRLFLRVVSPTNATDAVVRQELIDDRLRAQLLRQVGLELSEEGIREGMEEFASRANLSADDLIKALAQRGIAEETFRDFVAVGVAWRDLIRARFGNRVQISEAEIDRAMAASTTGSGVRVLLSEIIMPAPPPQLDTVMARAERIAQVTTEAEFSSYARQFSATPSRGRGGRLDWAPLSNLPPILRARVLGLAPGEVTQPIPIPNAVALFQLRAIEETGASTPEYSAIEYARYYIPGGRSEAAMAEAARIRTKVDVCDDLYGIAQGRPEEALARDTQAPGDIPQDIALELAKLDNNEVSTALTTADGQSLVFLMLCGRTTAANEEVSREAVANSLRQERLSGFADSLLEELRADARIREK
ncbi:peptidylprolyl isomerase [Aliishimia ponticola]|nr:peptidylprolyl isomerase [Aliishimia ponticola]